MQKQMEFQQAMAREKISLIKVQFFIYKLYRTFFKSLSVQVHQHLTAIQHGMKMYYHQCKIPIHATESVWASKAVIVFSWYNCALQQGADIWWQLSSGTIMLEITTKLEQKKCYRVHM